MDTPPLSPPSPVVGPKGSRSIPKFVLGFWRLLYGAGPLATGLAVLCGMGRILLDIGEKGFTQIAEYAERVKPPVEGKAAGADGGS